MKTETLNAVMGRTIFDEMGTGTGNTVTKETGCETYSEVGVTTVGRPAEMFSTDDENVNVKFIAADNADKMLRYVWKGDGGNSVTASPLACLVQQMSMEIPEGLGESEASQDYGADLVGDSNLKVSLYLKQTLPIM